MSGRSRAENGSKAVEGGSAVSPVSTRLSRLLRVDEVNCRSQPEGYLRLPVCGGVGAQGASVAGAVMGLGRLSGWACLLSNYTAFVEAGACARNGADGSCLFVRVSILRCTAERGCRDRSTVQVWGWDRGHRGL